MGQMLTAKQVAEVKGCSYQYVQRIIKEGKLQAQEILNDKNRKTYLVPLEALDEELQQKWYQMNLENPPEEISTPEPVTDKKAVDHFSESERQEIDFWISLVEQWQQYRMKPGVTCKADVDKKFVTLCGLEYPDKEISVDILYRKWKAVKENDLDGLIDKRGKWKKGTSSIDDTIWQAFLYFYLDESQHPIQKCLDYTKMWAQEKRPDLYTDIPSYSAFYRRLNNEVPEGVKVLGREGHKAYNDRCAPFIRRIYEDIESNEWWIADNHTFDVMVKDKNGNIHRPYLTAFLDARSGIFTGFHITYNPCSEATLIALRKGILKYGMAICTYAKKYLATVEMITVAQSNFSMLMDEMNRYPDLDTSEALIRLASHHVMNALTNVDEEQMKEVPIEKLIKETNGLIRAAAYKKRIEVQNRDNYEAGLEAVKSLVFEAMAKENPELYRQVSAYLNKKKNEGLEG